MLKVTVATVEDSTDKIYVSTHFPDTSLSIHGAAFSLNLPIEAARTLLTELRDKVLLIERLNEAKKGGG